MSDEDHAFLIEEAHNRDTGCEYNEELALDAQRQEERQIYGKGQSISIMIIVTTQTRVDTDRIVFIMDVAKPNHNQK